MERRTTDQPGNGSATMAVGREEVFTRWLNRVALPCSIAAAVILVVVLVGNVLLLDINRPLPGWLMSIVRQGPGISSALGVISLAATLWRWLRIVRRKQRFRLREEVTDQAFNVPDYAQGAPQAVRDRGGCLPALAAGVMAVAVAVTILTLAPAPLGILGRAPGGASSGSSSIVINGGLSDITRGGDGTFWFTELQAGKIGSVSPDGTVKDYALPGGHGTPEYITVGPDGTVWFTDRAGAIGHIDASGKISETPLSSDRYNFQTGLPTVMAVATDGSVWFGEATAKHIVRLAPDGTFSGFAVPTDPVGIAAGPDGNVWFTGSGSVWRATPGGTVTKFTPSNGSVPREIVAGSDGALWFVEGVANKVGRISTAGVITDYALATTQSAPSALTLGPDGNIYYGQVGKVGRISPSGAVSEYALPNAKGVPFGIAAGPGGNVWVVEYDRLDHITIS